MDDEVASSLQPGGRVVLTWPAEHAYVLGGD
jgi:hypothetical protein